MDGSVIHEQSDTKYPVSGITDRSGTYSQDLIISKDSPTGEYVVDLKVSARGYEDISITNIFIVNK